ncbi:MAG: Helix-turn-helix protein [Chloroflexi bacterium]|nr:Helix-turn-helix protein [Chloroflexota bacterium]
MARRIGERLRRARLAASLTQQELAAGRYTKAYVSALETGHSKPSMAALNFFAGRLGIAVSRFLDDEPATWRRLEVDLELASGRWQAATDGYLALLDQGSPREIRAELLRGLAEAHAGLDRGAEAAAAGAEAAQIFASVGREADAALARYWLAAGEYAMGNAVEAESIFREILSRVRGGLRVEPDFELRLVMALSSTASRDGRHDVALAYLEEVRGLADALDDHRRGTFLFDLAYSYRETGDYEAAIRTGIASLALFRATAYELGSAALENDLAMSYLALGNVSKADEFASSSQRGFEKLRDRRWLAHVLETRAQIALAAGDQAGSRDLASSALSLAEETHNDKATVSALLALARADRALGEAASALAYYERAVELARSTSRPGLIRDAIGEWADVLTESGEHERAAILLREALRAV